MEDLKKTHYIYPLVKWALEPIECEGYILDIGGGGEGVIAQLMGPKVVAIDFKKAELLEAADSPLKIIMDARDLKFLDGSFQTVTAFFSLMYLKTREDQQQVFREISRVIKLGGTFHLWDIDLGVKPDTDHDNYIVHLEYILGEKSKQTGYGSRWPEEPRGLDDYLDLAAKAGLQKLESTRIGHTFYLKLEKMTLLDP